ncbi:sigma-70 family RNA polymerase sigma factor [Sphingobium yanoikuyae]|jgi:RNA polymerase sigma factor (sigma-70 family)|uniref:Sigma-70 family RNA polymerase sigma factor n=4 Tax=Sphingobium TaxID=165695 RepID=K9D7Q3_SPHYA|nr:sigma-70 family RNA polymerase sigma factor [Sphingobium yanoikuyae]EKU73580.1 sigma-70 family RNA polymerase sigma factor [Sphingobium yanoikuyae ATCC 51230]MBB4149993.1 RNA polymerase sigma-70 factor (ECF subfamily) [Sphingobium scionense]PHP19949.1 sigma-70 family RNA polymerase sigma factor [Sphingobium sp. IP1]QCB39571.1 sigma-70 family RNA polymerase sigma factor [Sphingobium sp. PAMC28499]RSU74855.1 sigma-70 family RNA polymerase sigma factor [Sphingomonas sp. S-NIH.Pt3_0716]SHM0911
MATRLIANTGRTTGMATGLSAIFFQNRAALLRFLRARGAGEDAEDLLQDMWMKLEAKDLGPVADPLPYLYRMANNLMLDRYRSATRRERREQDWAEGAGGVMADPNDDLAVDERMILNQRLEQARGILADLGPRVELVFRRFRIEGVGQRLIAEELGVSLTTVEKDLQKAYRAMLALKQSLDTE